MHHDPRRAIALLEKQRAALSGQARLVMDAQPMREVRALEAVTAAKIQPNAYANAEGSGLRFTEKVVVIKS